MHHCTYLKTNTPEKICSPKTPIRRTSILLSEKKKLIELYHSLDDNACECDRQTGYDWRCVSRWLINCDQIRLVANSGSKRVFIKKGYFPELEKNLLDWINSIRQKKRAISGEAIRNECVNLIENSSRPMLCKDFKISKGWFWLFLERNHLSYRQSTHKA